MTVLLLSVVHLGTLAFALRAKPLGRGSLRGNASKPALSVRGEVFEEATWALRLAWEAVCVCVCDTVHVCVPRTGSVENRAHVLTVPLLQLGGCLCSRSCLGSTKGCARGFLSTRGQASGSLGAGAQWVSRERIGENGAWSAPGCQPTMVGTVLGAGGSSAPATGPSGARGSPIEPAGPRQPAPGSRLLPRNPLTLPAAWCGGPRG